MFITYCSLCVRVLSRERLALFCLRNLKQRIYVNKEKIVSYTEAFSLTSLKKYPACIDALCVSCCVSQFQDGVWTLSTTICDYLMTMDVMLCTASIFNLCAISIDRSAP